MTPPWPPFPSANASSEQLPSEDSPPPLTTIRTPLLLLKTRSTPHDAYYTYFNSSLLNYEPSFLPVLQHTYPSEALECLRALLVSTPPLAGYGGLICTSQRAVEALGMVLGSIRDAEPDSGSEDGNGNSMEKLRRFNVPLYTVGPATSRALEALREEFLPQCQVLGKETGNGGRLADYILANYHRPSHSPSSSTSRESALPVNDPLESSTTRDRKDSGDPVAPLLFLVGDTRRDIIPTTLQSSQLSPSQRIQVDESVVYETTTKKDFGAELKQALDATEVIADEESTHSLSGARWIAVFSPAGWAEVVQALLAREEEAVAAARRDSGRREGRSRVFVATIGPTTRDYLKDEFGLEADVCAETPSPEGLGRGIEAWMRMKAL